MQNYLPEEEFTDRLLRSFVQRDQKKRIHDGDVE
jgi:hypothetical protein